MGKPCVFYYDKFRFFTGLRPSEQIASRVMDRDLIQGKISITKARVMARDKDWTKASEDRLVELFEPKSERYTDLLAALQLENATNDDFLDWRDRLRWQTRVAP